MGAAWRGRAIKERELTQAPRRLAGRECPARRLDEAAIDRRVAATAAHADVEYPTKLKEAAGSCLDGRAHLSLASARATAEHCARVLHRHLP